MQPPGEEDRFAFRMPVRQIASIETHWVGSTGHSYLWGLLFMSRHSQEWLCYPLYRFSSAQTGVAVLPQQPGVRGTAHSQEWLCYPFYRLSSAQTGVAAGGTGTPACGLVRSQVHSQEWLCYRVALLDCVCFGGVTKVRDPNVEGACGVGFGAGQILRRAGVI